MSSLLQSCEPSEVTNTDMNLYKRCSEISYEVAFTLSTCIFFSYSKEINSIHIEDTHLLMDETGETKTYSNLVRIRRTKYGCK